MSADLSAVSDGDLSRMTARAFREAARFWQEARAFSGNAVVRRMLLTDAEAAETYWGDLVDEAERRLDQRSGIPMRPVETLTADPYLTQHMRRAAAKRAPARQAASK